MLAWLKSLFCADPETKRLKEENAKKERQILAAACAPDASNELIEAATMYFKSGTGKQVRKDGANGSR